MQPYERLDAWKAAHELAMGVHRAIKRWPVDERFALTAQIRRAALSVPVNIVEGRARLGKKDYRRFLGIAWGSLAEVEYLLRVARELGYLDAEDFDALHALRDKTARPLYGLLRSLPG